MSMRAPVAYPLRFEVDYAEGPRDRFSTLLRLIFAIPIGIVLGMVGGGGRENGGGSGGLLVLPALLMIVFRQKYPRWWFDWNVQLLRFTNRFAAYVLLLRDEYPSTDEEQAVHLAIDYPDAARDLNRWLPLVKWLLALPHYLVLAVLYIALLVVVIGAWATILVSGRYPRGLFDFVVGMMRWTNRVVAYAFLLSTDRYPPFRLGA